MWEANYQSVMACWYADRILIPTSSKSEMLDRIHMVINELYEVPRANKNLGLVAWDTQRRQAI